MDGTARRSQIFRLGPAPEGVKRSPRSSSGWWGCSAKPWGGSKKGDDVWVAVTASRRNSWKRKATSHESLGQLSRRRRDTLEIIKWRN